MNLRPARLLVVGALLASGLAVGAAAAGRAGASTPAPQSLTLRGAAYTPQHVNGATDDYHCTLVNPHVTHDSYIVSATFSPNSIEVHHAILFLIPPSLAATAKADDANGKGWTCFGESALPNSIPAQSGGAAPVTKTAAVTGGHGNGSFSNRISNTPWLTAWAPGHGTSYMPKGTGVQLPAGSLVVMQIHYNLLRGDKPVRSSLTLHTVPASTHLQPLGLDLMVAPPDVPCATGVTGPLCDRTAELASLDTRFGPGASFFDNIIERVCGRDPSTPPVGDTTSCVWPTEAGQTILQVTAHMHLTGRAMQVVLDPGTPNQQTLLDVKNYNFDYQKTYTLPHPVVTKPGDTIAVTCTYDPTLAQELPQLRKLAPHFTVWGDGSSDEMCLAIMGTVHGTYRA